MRIITSFFVFLLAVPAFSADFYYVIAAPHGHSLSREELDQLQKDLRECEKNTPAASQSISAARNDCIDKLLRERPRLGDLINMPLPTK
jgi:hypothetical protein